MRNMKTNENDKLGFTRREFLSSAACTAAMAGVGSAMGAAEDLTALSTFPDWAVKRIEDGLRRYRAWKGADLTVAFPLVTDLHSHGVGFEVPVKWGDSRSHVLFQRAIAREVGADFLANLGDLDLDIDTNPGTAIPAKEQVEGVIDGFRKVYGGESRPVVFALGNHDHAKKQFSSKQFGDAFNRGIGRLGEHGAVLSDCGSWGYLDFPEKKFRAVFLNSSDEGYVGYSKAQLQFFADTLMTTPEGWHVAAMEHVSMPYEFARWRRFCEPLGANRTGILETIAEDFANRRGDLVENFFTPPVKGSYKGIRWDFSQSKAHFVGWFMGHSHTENHVAIAGVNYTIRPGYGTVPKDCLCGGQRDPKDQWVFQRSSDMMIDLVAVKPAERRVHVFRFGRGGDESELEYVY